MIKYEKIHPSINLDHVKRRLSIFTILVVLLDFILFLSALILVINYIDGHFWTQSLHLFILIQTINLFIFVCQEKEVYKIIGTGHYSNVSTNFSYYIFLYNWWILSKMSFFFLYWWIIVVDIYLFTQEKLDRTQFFLYLFSDIIFSAEHIASYFLIYKFGIFKPMVVITGNRNSEMKWA